MRFLVFILLFAGLFFLFTMFGGSALIGYLVHCGVPNVAAVGGLLLAGGLVSFTLAS